MLSENKEKTITTINVAAIVDEVYVYAGQEIIGGGKGAKDINIGLVLDSTGMNGYASTVVC